MRLAYLQPNCLLLFKKAGFHCLTLFTCEYNSHCSNTKLVKNLFLFYLKWCCALLELVRTVTCVLVHTWANSHKLQGHWPVGQASRPVSICRRFSGFNQVPSWEREWLTIWKKKRTRMFLCFFLISTKSITHSDSSPYLLQWISIFLLQLYRYLVTSCFWSSPSWLRSNRLKISSVLRESTGWFDSSCPWLDAVVWLSIRPLSWASCTTTRHSSSDRKPGISDKNRKKTTVANVRTHCSLGHA